MGKGMDGHAGKDLVVKVPCGTLVWRIGGATPPRRKMRGGHGRRPRGKTAVQHQRRQAAIVPHAPAAGGAQEIDLSREEPGAGAAAHAKGELVADLTRHGQQFILCQGGRGGLGNRNFATAARQTPRLPNRASRAGKATSCSSCASSRRSGWSAIPTPANPRC